MCWYLLSRYLDSRLLLMEMSVSYSWCRDSPSKCPKNNKTLTSVGEKSYLGQSELRTPEGKWLYSKQPS